MSEFVSEPVSVPIPISFQAFAATLRPQPIRNLQGRQVGLTAGQPDEIWLKHVGRLHSREKHPVEEWNALIGRYASQGAYT